MALGQEYKCIENSSCIPESEKDSWGGQAVIHALDKMPEYPGGMAALHKFLAKNIKMYGKGDVVHGKMFISFIVDTTGHVQNPCISKSCFEVGIYYKEEEILNVFKKLAIMQPGEHRGQKVPVRFFLPIAY